MSQTFRPKGGKPVGVPTNRIARAMPADTALTDTQRELVREVVVHRRVKQTLEEGLAKVQKDLDILAATLRRSRMNPARIRDILGVSEGRYQMMWQRGEAALGGELPDIANSKGETDA